MIAIAYFFIIFFIVYAVKITNNASKTQPMYMMPLLEKRGYKNIKKIDDIYNFSCYTAIKSGDNYLINVNKVSFLNESMLKMVADYMKKLHIHNGVIIGNQTNRELLKISKKFNIELITFDYLKKYTGGYENNKTNNEIVYPNLEEKIEKKVISSSTSNYTKENIKYENNNPISENSKNIKKLLGRKDGPITRL